VLIIGPTARRIAAGACNYIVTRFPPGHDVPVCEIDREWFADLAQKEIHAGRDADLRAAHAALLAATGDGLAFVRHALEFFDWTAFPHLHASVEELRGKMSAAVKLAEGG
jgi:hypothetical protein